jgi:hypothetical protein
MLPGRPAEFPKGLHIGLEPNEAGFLAGLLTDPVVNPRDRHAARRHASRLPPMLEEALDPGVWDWRTVPTEASPELGRRLEDAACFADLAWSARALYALMVAERAEEGLDDHRAQLDAAERRVRTGRAIAAWDLDRFARDVLRERPRVGRGLIFLGAWRDLVLQTRGGLERSDDARERITDRESRVKPGRTRLTGEQPEPVAVAWPYDFRAEVARSIVADVKDARP